MVVLKILKIPRGTARLSLPLLKFWLLQLFWRWTPPVTYIWNLTKSFEQLFLGKCFCFNIFQGITVFTIVTQKVKNCITSFVYVIFLLWLVSSLSAVGKNLAGSFNNINLNIKFRKKYNWKQARLCFKISQGIPEWSKLLHCLLFKF